MIMADNIFVVVPQSNHEIAKDYSLVGSLGNQIFGSSNAISIIATSFASEIIPEIQATIAPPVEGKMFKGLCMGYAVAISTYLSVAISGYWVFGNQAQGTILANFMGPHLMNPLLPKWLIG